MTMTLVIILVKSEPNLKMNTYRSYKINTYEHTRKKVNKVSEQLIID